MTDQPDRPRPTISPREEKLQAIAAVFGDAVAARLAKSPAPGPTQHGASPTLHTDADRIAWQKNRLIQHLRTRVSGDIAPPPAPAAPPASAPRAATMRSRPVYKLPQLTAGEDLSAEHPAVIAHLLKDAPQQMRVLVLRALPGQVARAVMRRLKSA